MECGESNSSTHGKANKSPLARGEENVCFRTTPMPPLRRFPVSGSAFPFRSHRFRHSRVHGAQHPCHSCGLSRRHPRPPVGRFTLLSYNLITLGYILAVPAYVIASAVFSRFRPALYHYLAVRHRPLAVIRAATHIAINQVSSTVQRTFERPTAHGAVRSHKLHSPLFIVSIHIL